MTYELKEVPQIGWPDASSGLLYRPQQTLPAQHRPGCRPELYRELDKQSLGPDMGEGPMAEIRRFYLLPGDSSVVDFLNSNNGIHQVLLDSIPQIKKYFGAAVRCSLESRCDESGDRTLYAVVRWPGPVHAVRHALAKFDDEWWLLYPCRGGGHLVFTYELE